MAAEKTQNTVSDGAQGELVPEKRPPMPAELHSALMSRGKEDYIKQCLGLSEQQKEVKVQIEKKEDTVQQTETKYQINLIHCATEYGDTVLHLLIHNGQDMLALEVFQKEKSLLRAQNKYLETPLHIAARTGRMKIVSELIQLDSEYVKDALAITDCKGNTTLHIAARHGNKEIGRELMKLDTQVARKENDQGLSPLYVAIESSYTEMVQTMLEEDPNLPFSRNSVGMYPIHVAAREGNKNLVNYIMGKYPTYANLLDPQGRNFVHIAAIENQSELFELSQYGKVGISMVRKMNDATDYQGNTPLHIAAIRGHRLTMTVICKNRLNINAQKIRNREGYKPLELSARQVKETSEIKDIKDRIHKYISSNDYNFTARWFEDIMAPSDESKWERTQVIGLGAVLITTVTFAAAFTVPGGYNQNDGTPILGRKIAYKAFTVANTLSFALAFRSLYTLVSSALVDPDYAHLKEATDTFTTSAGFMVIAFALGSYVMLVPVSLPIAITVLVVTMPLGSPFVSLVVIFRSLYENIPLLLQWVLQLLQLVQLLLLAVWVGMGA